MDSKNLKIQMLGGRTDHILFLPFLHVRKASKFGGSVNMYTLPRTSEHIRLTAINSMGDHDTRPSSFISANWTRGFPHHVMKLLTWEWFYQKYPLTALIFSKLRCLCSNLELPCCVVFDCGAGRGSLVVRPNAEPESKSNEKMLLENCLKLTKPV